MPIQAAIPFNPMIAEGGPDRGTPILNRMNALKQQRFENTMAEKASALDERRLKAYEGQVGATARAQDAASAARGLQYIFGMASGIPGPAQRTEFVRRHAGPLSQIWPALGLENVPTPDWANIPPEAVDGMIQQLGIGGERSGSVASGVQEYQEAVRTGFKGSMQEWEEFKAEVGRTPPRVTSVVPVMGPDGTITYADPASAVGGKVPPTPDKPPTEAQAVAAGYLSRMRASEQYIGTYMPSATDYAAAMTALSAGPIFTGFANAQMSPEAQVYFQNTGDWVRAKLRKESGAAIPADEMQQEIKTYFPVPGDSPAAVAAKARSRKQAEQALLISAGNAKIPDPVPMPQSAFQTGIGPYEDPEKEKRYQEYLRSQGGG